MNKAKIHRIGLLIPVACLLMAPAAAEASPSGTICEDFATVPLGAVNNWRLRTTPANPQGLPAQFWFAEGGASEPLEVSDYTGTNDLYWGHELIVTTEIEDVFPQQISFDLWVFSAPVDIEVIDIHGNSLYQTTLGQGAHSWTSPAFPDLVSVVLTGGAHETFIDNVCATW